MIKSFHFNKNNDKKIYTYFSWMTLFCLYIMYKKAATTLAVQNRISLCVFFSSNIHNLYIIFICLTSTSYFSISIGFLISIFTIEHYEHVIVVLPSPLLLPLLYILLLLWRVLHDIELFWNAKSVFKFRAKINTSCAATKRLSHEHRLFVHNLISITLLHPNLIRNA